MTLYRTTIEIEIAAPDAEAAKRLADGIAAALADVGFPVCRAWHHDEGLYPSDFPAPRGQPPPEQPARPSPR